MEQYDHIVIGAGPAGLFAAIQACEKDSRIAILEKMPRPGIKLLLSGSGQCNVTNAGDMEMFPEHYGEARRFMKHSLYTFTNNDLMEYFKERGVDMSVREDGKVFPASLRARDILDALLTDCREKGVEIIYGKKVISLEYREGSFSLNDGDVERPARSVLIATGGKSYPSTGSSGDGYELARKLGHDIIPTRPALVGLEVEGYPFAGLAGIAVRESAVSIYRSGKKVRDHRGDVLFTHTGLSGPGILDISRYIEAGDEITMTMTSMENREVFRKALLEKISGMPSQTVKKVLANGNIPVRLAECILDFCGIARDCRAGEMKKESRNRLVNALTGLPLHVRSTGGFDRAMCTAGGISLKEVNPRTMESKIIPGLYFAGEVLDVDGDTGGYNLQAAFSTAWVAGNDMKKYSAENC